MTYRLLTNEEKAKLFEVFPQYAGQDVSNVPIAGALDDGGTVRGFAVLNYVPHVEPVFIESGQRVDFRRLLDVVATVLPVTTLWLFAPNDHIARMAEIAGGQEMTDWRVFRKELT